MRALLCLLLMIATARAEWRLALPGWQYEFPRDHGNHADFKTEWWYFTGNLEAKDGREFGYQLTFFRQGVIGADEAVADSHFATRDIEFAHFALSDISGRKFSFFQELSRGAFGEAGFEQGARLAWIKDWSVERVGENGFRLHAKDGTVALDLNLTSERGPIINGANGVSQKGDGEGQASHYYSLPRLVSEGTVRVGKEEFPVKGLSWFDHEWATNQLGKDQAGWDWLSLHFSGGGDMMLFQLRKKAGGRDSHSSGTFIDAKGNSSEIAANDFTMEPLRYWTSPVTKGRYPVEWKITIPSRQLAITVRAAQDNQELSLKPMGYWEGAVRVEGTLNGQPTQAKGYLEMTGYAGEIVGMSAK
jgi:predicted secreted hydrolase